MRKIKSYAIIWEKREVKPMKKIIIAFIAGALVMVSGQALADTVSQIGKKVDSEASVYVNGEKVSDAIIIQGKSYVPGRDVAEALGGTVEWKGSENAIMISNFTTDEEIEEYNSKLIEYNKKKAEITASINSANRKIERLEGYIEKYNLDLADTDNAANKEYLESEIDRYTKELETEKANLAKYEKELQELESTK